MADGQGKQQQKQQMGKVKVHARRYPVRSKNPKNFSFFLKRIVARTQVY
jgi:hypothetical protein